MKTPRLPFVICFIATAAFAGAIKVWNLGDTLSSGDLNANFAHIHNTMVGGHGARLVNADVSTTAAISHSKLATPALMPKAWASTGTTGSCGATPCNLTLAASSGVATISNTGAGTYTVTWSTARANASYTVLLTGNAANYLCASLAGTQTTTTVNVVCRDVPGAASANTPFSVLLMDDN